MLHIAPKEQSSYIATARAIPPFGVTTMRSEKIHAFHNACVAVVMSDKTDDYLKAGAQVGLGLWDEQQIQQVAAWLFRNLLDIKGHSDERSLFRRYSRS